MFREPTAEGLKAQAGWALLKRAETTPEHAVALDKYRDGCEALIPYAHSGAAEQISGEVKLPVEVAVPPRFETSYPAASVADTSTCQHRFYIHDQRCRHCGITRFHALAQRGRKPELQEC